MATKSQNSGSKNTETSIASYAGPTYTTPVVLVSNIVDRWEGLSQTFEVWGENPSARYVSQLLSNVADREEVAKFFISRGFAAVFKELVKLRTIKPTDCVLTKTELFEALNRVLTVQQAGVVMELILPSLMSFGIVSSSMKYSTHIRYGFNPVTTDAVRNDVAVYQIMQTVKATKTAGISKDVKYSVATLAELLAEEYRKIGLQMYEISDLAAIVTDMIYGVRAAIDPDYSGGALKGSVPNEWKNSRVIDELAKNLVFVKAALALAPGLNISLASEGWKLNQWGPIILTALQSSERYAWVSKTETVRTYGLSKVRDTRGRVKSAVLYRSAKVTPIAQTVFALEDSLMSGAYNISPTKDRIADVIQSAYGSATFGTAAAAMLYQSVLSDAVEAGWNSGAPTVEFDIITGAASAQDLCCLLADRLYVELPKADATALVAGDDGSMPEYEPNWSYVVGTDELDIDFTPYPDTEHRGQEVFTTSREVVLLAHPEFSPLEDVASKPQVFGAAAFNTRLVSFDDRVLHQNKNRFAFSMTINNVNMQGSIRPSNFASMRTGDFTSVVIPHYNKSIVDQTVNILTGTLDLVNKLEKSSSGSWLASKPSEQFFALLRRRVARFVLETAQQLAPGFRKEINDAIIDRTLSSRETLGLEEALVLRAKLAQRAYAACADVVALEFFLFIQGMSNEDFSALLVGEEMMRAYLEMGSDRQI